MLDIIKVGLYLLLRLQNPSGQIVDRLSQTYDKGIYSMVPCIVRYAASFNLIGHQVRAAENTLFLVALSLFLSSCEYFLFIQRHTLNGIIKPQNMKNGRMFDSIGVIYCSKFVMLTLRGGVKIIFFGNNFILKSNVFYDKIIVSN